VPRSSPARHPRAGPRPGSAVAGPTTPPPLVVTRLEALHATMPIMESAIATTCPRVSAALDHPPTASRRTRRLALVVRERRSSAGGRQEHRVPGRAADRARARTSAEAATRARAARDPGGPRPRSRLRRTRSPAGGALSAGARAGGARLARRSSSTTAGPSPHRDHGGRGVRRLGIVDPANAVTSATTSSRCGGRKPQPSAIAPT
jgi:hypothetical protein